MSYNRVPKTGHAQNGQRAAHREIKLEYAQTEIYAEQQSQNHWKHKPARHHAVNSGYARNGANA